MRPNDVAQALDLDRVAKDHVWKVEPSCATSGEGKNRVPIKEHFQERRSNQFIQASSKVSLGSAKMSRLRRSKREEKQASPSLLRNHPTRRKSQQCKEMSALAGTQPTKQTSPPRIPNDYHYSHAPAHPPYMIDSGRPNPWN